MSTEAVDDAALYRRVRELYPHEKHRRDAIRSASGGRTTKLHELTPDECKRIAEVSRDTLADFPTPLLARVRAFSKQFPGAIFLPVNTRSKNGKTKDKLPMLRGGSRTASNDPEQLNEWFGEGSRATGYAVYPGPGLLVIDLDVKDGKDGPGELAALEREHGKLPITATVRSPSAGKHLMLTVPLAAEIPSCNGYERDGKLHGVALGIDIRASDGRYFIVGPGSETSKGRYEWEIGPEKIAPAPQWLIEKCQEAGSARCYEPVDLDDPADELDQLRYIDRFITHCQTTAPAIEGDSGDQRTYEVAAVGGDLALSEGTIFEIMLEHFNPRCAPPWEPDDLLEKVRSGRKNRRKRIGAGTVKGQFSDLLQHSPAPEREPEGDYVIPGAFYYLESFDAIPDPTYLIDGIIPESGYSLIYGRRSTYKSFIALDQSLSLATGQPYHGREVKRGRVVYFAGEGFRGARRRVDAWFKARKLDRAAYARDFALVPLNHQWDTRAGREYIEGVLGEIAEDGPIALVIIDTASTAMAEEENSPSHVRNFLNDVADICRPYDCARVIVHHEGKDASRGARGGGPWEDNADAVFRVIKERPGFTKLKCTKQKDDDADWALVFRADVIPLGKDEKGEPIKSLALTLDNEFTSGEDDSSELSGYTAHDTLAIQILKRCEETYAIPRATLASEVMGNIAPDIRETDPVAFKKALRAYIMHLARLNKPSTLWPYVGERNDKGEPLSFIDPERKGRRAPKPKRKRGLAYTLPIFDGESE